MTVVFFCPNILRNVHRDIFQLDRLKKEGINFILLDATEYYGNKSTATEKIILDNKIECQSKEDFKKFRSSLPEEPVLYITFDNYMKFAAPVLQIIIRKKDKLLTYHTKRFSNAYDPSGTLREITDEFIKKADKIFPLQFFRNFYWKRHGLYVPDYFLCSTEFLIPTKVYLTIKKENRIIVHSDDINKTLNGGPSLLPKNKKVGVFLDQVIPFQKELHPLVKDIDPGENYVEIYYENLQRSLSSLKEKFNLDEVVIALHPDAIKYEKILQEQIKDFKTFIGASHELIRDADFVFGHGSTALGFAIYYKKPIILLKDDYTREIVGNYMTFFENELGLTSINMNDREIDVSVGQVDEDKYNSYIKKYLKDNDIKENSFVYAINKIRKDLEL